MPMEYPSKLFQSICTQLGYRRKTVRVHSTESVTLSGLNWDSGSKNTYHSCNLLSGDIRSHEHFGIAHPWNNEREGARVALIPNMIVIRTGIFMGKVAKMDIYVHPSNIPQLLEKIDVQLQS